MHMSRTVTMMLLGLLCLANVAVGNERPNVVLIVSDDQAWTDFGFMGHDVIRTPHLDRLASESAVFPHGYVPTSLCRASLATLLTGYYGHQHRICCNDPPDGVDRAAMHPFMQNAAAVPRMLAKSGYRSLQTGKFWEGHYRNAGFTQGMTVKGRHGDDGLAIGRKTMQPIYDFIEEAPEKPFFLWYAPMMPHTPHNPPQRFLDKYAQEGRPLPLAKYYAMCEWFDETCGQLLDYLDEKGLRENTAVIFVVDNGWIQETGPRRTTRGWFAPKSKLSPYDGGLRTPVMIRWPGQVPAGRHDDLVSTIDVAPTIYDITGTEIPDDLPGLSLLPAARGAGDLPRDAVFGEIYVHTAVDLQEPALNLTHLWVREGHWKLIKEMEGPSFELYRLSDDPLEERDVAKDHPETVARLNRRLLEWWPGAIPPDGSP